ncbi:uncharacterized protein LOC141859286 [Acropora palmata]|uniref:uncharacterized protein LOC141859286 n=1 Tax=Acropora palmata TaxID=6131 RepID=UPI003DA0B798
MAERTSRKRNAPARLREESCYLVCYEDDFCLRVMHEDEVQHIFPDESEEDIQVGDIISALWIPNGQYYDAKVLQTGCDKNELMKERIKLEKEKKNGKEPVTSGKGKQKQQGSSNKENQPRKEKRGQRQKDGNKEKEQKAKEREEKKKKRVEDKQRQALFLETRKSQAAARWASTCSPIPSHHKEAEVTVVGEVHATSAAVFTPLPIRSRNLASEENVHIEEEHTLDNVSTPSCHHSFRQTSLSLPSAKRQKTTPVSRSLSSSSESSESPRGHNSSNLEESPREQLSNRYGKCDPRKGLHFQSSLVESSSEGEDDNENVPDPDLQAGNSQVSHGSCCKEQKLENEVLRERIQKLHRRLNIALKAKTTEDITNNRPAPGVLDQSLATEYKMVELMEGSGVFWYSQQRAYCSAIQNWSGYVNAAIDIFFSKEKLTMSCAKGIEKKSKTGAGHEPLNPVIVQAIIGKACSKFNKEGITAS